MSQAPTDPNTESKKICCGISILIGSLLGKRKTFPKIDKETLHQVQASFDERFSRFSDKKRGDFCQELRGLLRCPVSELLTNSKLSESEIRLIHSANTIRTYAELSKEEFREVTLAFVGWDEKDQDRVLYALRGVTNS